MPHRGLRHAGGLVVHVVNRAVRRHRLFFDSSDYRAFERVLAQAVRRIRTRLLAFCIMPNHWHLVIWVEGSELPQFMQWLTMVHAKRWHKAHGSQGTGHVYQDRYYATPVQTGRQLFAVLRYVERNALRAGLVPRAEEWRWGSLWHRCHSSDIVPLSSWPIAEPEDWIAHVNQPQSEAEVVAIREAIRRSVPIGEDDRSSQMAAGPGQVRRPRGRPPRRPVE